MVVVVNVDGWRKNVSCYLPSKLAKTMTKHVPKYTSIDLTYDILGKAAFVDDISVVIVNTVVTPSATLAGVAFRLSQNDTHLSNGK